LLTPRETVAPVGSEVVVLAGVRGDDNFLRTNQRIEWMLEQQGVGYFADVGKNGFLDFLLGDFNFPKKVNNTFAIGSTSSSTFRLTCGTPLPGDDVTVLAGQAWISVASASEGVSYVTALAPGIEGWDGRKRTTAIHWVDVQWGFPPPAINPVGTRHVFTTTVSRQTNQSPCAGWIVRYEITGGPAAGFSPAGTQSVEIPVDPLGQASVEIFQTEAVPGINTIAIQVIRPAEPGKRQLVIGSGTTTKTWTAPRIAVAVTGPPSAQAGQTITYRLAVSNPGDLPATGVVVTDTLPDGLELVTATPEAARTGRQLQWSLGQVGPGETRSIDVTCRASGAATVTHCAEVVTAEGLKASDCATTTLTQTTLTQATAAPQPSIDVTVTGPEQVDVGSQVQFIIEVFNRSSVPITGLRVRDFFDSGLAHAEKTSPIDNPMNDLAAGQSQKIGVTFQATRAGELCHTVEVTADGGLQATERKCVRAVESGIGQPPGVGPGVQQPGVGPPAEPAQEQGLSIRITGPRQQRVGEKAQFAIEITNAGDRPLSEVRVVNSCDPELDQSRATEGNTPVGDDIVWVIDAMPVGTFARLMVECNCLKETAEACTRVVATSKEGVEARDEVCLEILPAGAPVAPGTGGLTLSVADRGDPVDEGKEFSYDIRVTNTGLVADRQVTLLVTVPPELNPVPLLTTGPTPANAEITGQIVRFPPIDTIAPGETLTYRVRVVAPLNRPPTVRPPGTVRLIAEVSSLAQPMAIRSEEDTTITVPMPGGTTAPMPGDATAPMPGDATPAPGAGGLPAPGVSGPSLGRPNSGILPPA